MVTNGGENDSPPYILQDEDTEVPELTKLLFKD
jgi:hypothetical protein